MVNMDIFNELTSKTVKMGESAVLVQSLLNVNFSDKAHHLLLKACEEQQAFSNVNEKLRKRLIANINIRLSKFKNRESGLQLLKILLQKCPERVFKKHWTFWVLICSKAAENVQFSNEACDALWMLIDASRHFQLPTKQLSKCIAMVLSYVLNTSKIHSADLRCLELLLCYYGSNCKQKLDEIQTFLLRLLDEEDGELIEAAGKCMCYVPLLLASEVKDGQFGGDLQAKLCTTGTLLMDELISNIYRNFNSSPAHLPVGIQLETIQENSIPGIYKKANRLKNILKFIERMFMDDRDNSKTLYADSMVAMAQHVLEVNLQRRQCGGTDQDIALWCVLPNLQMAAFNLLRTFVCCNLSDLQKYGPVFGKIIMQTLKCTSYRQDVSHLFRQLREGVYKFLDSWVLRGRSASYVHLDVEELISQILVDVQKKETGYSKVQKRCESLCEVALLSLNTLVLAGGTMLSYSTCSKLEELVVSGLLKIQQLNGFRDTPSPYNETGCRLQLYRLLQALTLRHHSELFFDAQEVRQLFLFGKKDCSPEVAGFCTLALASTSTSTSASISQNNIMRAQKRKWRKTSGIANYTVDSTKAGQKPKQIRFARKKSTKVITCSNGNWKVEKTPVEVNENKTSSENINNTETSLEVRDNNFALERISEGIKQEATWHKSFQGFSYNKQSTDEKCASSLVESNVEEINCKLAEDSCCANDKHASFCKKDKDEEECSLKLIENDNNLEISSRCKLNTVKSPDKRETESGVNDTEESGKAGEARSFMYHYQENGEKKLNGQSASNNFSRSCGNSLEYDSGAGIVTGGKNTGQKQTIDVLDSGCDLDIDVEEYLLAYVMSKEEDPPSETDSDSQISEKGNLNYQEKKYW